jgi:aspartate aminotransferase-like enzyme
MTMPPTEFGTFYLPGPTEVRRATLEAMVKPMIPHRGLEFREMYGRIEDRLKTVFATRRPVLIATSSATGLMEAAIRNAPPGRVLALVNGAFSERFANIASACGRTVDRYDVPWGEVHETAQVSIRLGAASYAVVTVVHSETSTGALNDVRAISDAAHAAGVVCCIDSVSGIRGAELHFDEWGLDYVFTGSQKALALPPGLAIAVASETFLAHGTREGRGVYFDLTEIAAAAEQNEAPNTPALPLYYALDVQLDHILKEGMPAAWARHATMARMTADWVDTLAAGRGLAVAVLAPAGHRSPTVTTIVLPPGVQGDVIAKSVAGRGYTIGSGYGKLKATTVRIGHMGDHNPAGLARCLDVCEAALAEAARGSRGMSASAAGHA